MAPITVLMDSYNGKKLNAPNDVVVGADGAVWFTDPGFGIPRQLRRAPSSAGAAAAGLSLRSENRAGNRRLHRKSGQTQRHYFLAGREEAIHIDSALPDPARSDIRVFDVSGDKISNGKVFASNFGAAGTTTAAAPDVDGNLWCSMGSACPAKTACVATRPMVSSSAKSICPRPAPIFALAARRRTVCS